MSAAGPRGAWGRHAQLSSAASSSVCRWLRSGLCVRTFLGCVFVVLTKSAKSLSHVRLFATPWTGARQAPPSLGILQARVLEWVAMSSARGVFPTQGLNLGLLHCRRILHHLSQILWEVRTRTEFCLNPGSASQGVWPAHAGPDPGQDSSGDGPQCRGRRSSFRRLSPPPPLVPAPHLDCLSPRVGESFLLPSRVCLAEAPSAAIGWNSHPSPSVCGPALSTGLCLPCTPGD